MLIEDARPSDALSALASKAGDELTHEVLRLRAIAHHLTGDRPAAMRDAASAVTKASLEIAPLFTLATMRLLLSLIVSVNRSIFVGDGRQLPGGPDLLGMEHKVYRPA